MSDLVLQNFAVRHRQCRILHPAFRSVEQRVLPPGIRRDALRQRPYQPRRRSRRIEQHRAPPRRGEGMNNDSIAMRSVPDWYSPRPCRPI